MNTAARFLNQSYVSRTWIISVLLDRVRLSSIILSMGILISALSLIYVTSTTRGLHAYLQQSLAEQDRLQIQWGQLLLEKSTWSMPARIQQVASDKMGMELPTTQSVVIINE